MTMIELKKEKWEEFLKRKLTEKQWVYIGKFMFYLIIPVFLFLGFLMAKDEIFLVKIFGTMFATIFSLFTLVYWRMGKELFQSFKEKLDYIFRGVFFLIFSIWLWIGIAILC